MPNQDITDGSLTDATTVDATNDRVPITQSSVLKEASPNILVGKISSVSGFSWVTDEDDMASDSATKVPTEQSVKAYVDGKAVFQLDATLSADGTYSGIVEAGTAGAALAFGDLVYLAVADSRWELADASAVATGTMKLGICVEAAASDGSATTILLWGKVRADTAFPTLTVAAPVFMSEAAGDITNTAPSTSSAIVRVLGYGNTGDELQFQPSNDWIELA
jgi:hypothetical protein